MRYAFAPSAVGATLLFLSCGAGFPADPFPLDQELLLDAAPMRPGKRMPVLSVEPNGTICGVGLSGRVWRFLIRP